MERSEKSRKAGRAETWITWVRKSFKKGKKAIGEMGKEEAREKNGEGELSNVGRGKKAMGKERGKKEE